VIRGEGGNGLGVGLCRGLQGLDGGDEGLHGGPEVLAIPMAAAQDAVDEDQERAARRLVVARECGAVRKPWIVIPGCQGRRD
jgi:hypothetical protein